MIHGHLSHTLISTTLTDATNSIVIESFTYRRSNTLRGFCTIRLPSGLIMLDVAIHATGAALWAAPPSKPVVGRDGNLVRGSNGKLKYSPVIAFATKDVRDRFSRGVIEALHAAYPDALGDAS